MKLNSVPSGEKAARVAGISVLAIAAILLLSFAPFFSFAAGTTVTVQTNATFSAPATGGTSIPVNGTVSPAPGVAGYAVTVELTNPSGLFVAQSASVNPTTGFYTTTFVSSTPAQLWGNGTYTVTAVYAPSAQGATSTASTTFSYGTFVPTTTTSSSTSTGSSGSGSGTTTTVVSVTTINSITTVNSVTTITQGGTTITSLITQGGTTITSVITQAGTTIVTTVSQTVSGSGSSTTAEALAAVGIVIAIIAGAIAAMALRKH